MSRSFEGAPIVFEAVLLILWAQSSCALWVTAATNRSAWMWRWWAFKCVLEETRLQFMFYLIGFLWQQGQKGGAAERGWRRKRSDRASLPRFLLGLFDVETWRGGEDKSGDVIIKSYLLSCSIREAFTWLVRNGWHRGRRSNEDKEAFLSRERKRWRKKGKINMQERGDFPRGNRGAERGKEQAGMGVKEKKRRGNDKITCEIHDFMFSPFMCDLRRTTWRGLGRCPRGGGPGKEQKRH